MNLAHARGLCRGHYQQRARGATLRPLRERAGRPGTPVRTCTAIVTPACDRPVLSLGYCSRHYYRYTHDLPMQD